MKVPVRNALYVARRKRDAGGEVADDQPADLKPLYNAIAPAPNTEYGSILPIARDTQTGEKRADGDHVDVYIGPHKDSRQVFLINQIDHKSRRFDEHKAMLGYHSEREALGDYCRAFSDGKGHARVGSVETMSLDGFKNWLKDGNTKRPADARHVIDRALLLARKGVHTRNGRMFRPVA